MQSHIAKRRWRPKEPYGRDEGHHGYVEAKRQGWRATTPSNGPNKDRLHRSAVPDIGCLADLKPVCAVHTLCVRLDQYRWLGQHLWRPLELASGRLRIRSNWHRS